MLPLLWSHATAGFALATVLFYALGSLVQTRRCCAWWPVETFLCTVFFFLGATTLLLLVSGLIPCAYHSLQQILLVSIGAR